MQFYTLNSLINQFRYVSQNHAQIKGFNFGRDAEIAASEQEKYPLLWIDVTDSNIEGTVMTVSILMKVIDIQQPDRDNEIENLSDMLSIGQDVYAAMSDPAYQDFFIIQYASSLTPIREAYTDLVNGWEMRLDFSFMQDRNRCQIPTNDIPFPPVASCAKANLTLNGVEFLEAESGATTNIELVNQNNDEITPTSVVGNKIVVNDEIEVRNTDNTFTDTATPPEYIIPDTKIILKNNFDTVLSETEFSSCVDGELIAPNLLVTVNGEEFLSIPAGATQDIELVDQDNVEITPLSLVSNTIEVERYLFTSIDSGTITPNSIYGILSGETI
jgi:hypothetical protein